MTVNLSTANEFIARHIGPQNGSALGHAAFDDGIDGKEAAGSVGIYPGLRATVEDDDVGTLDGTGEDQAEPEIIKPHARCQFTQQGHYGALIIGHLKLSDEIQRMQGVHFYGMRIMHKIGWPNMETYRMLTSVNGRHTWACHKIGDCPQFILQIQIYLYESTVERALST